MHLEPALDTVPAPEPEPAPGLSLAQDLCARICHDLGGPLGSITGALELLGQEDEAAGVARDSVEAAARRLQLWRVVGGAGAGPLGRSAIAALLDGAMPGGRSAAALDGLAEDELAPATARAVLAAAMLAAEALPRGGTVHVAAEADGFAVWPEGRSAGWPPALAAALSGASVRGPREVLAPLLLVLAREAGLRVDLAMGRDPRAGPLTLRLR